MRRLRVSAFGPRKLGPSDDVTIKTMLTWDLTTHDLEVHKPEVLHSDEGAARGIGILLPAGDELQDHETRESAWIVVASGEVEVDNQGQTQRGGAGSVFHFEAHERRGIKAVSEARLLLVLAPWPAPDHQTG
jgi:quercetin dioxygenase-like cupin family protein